MSVFVYANIKLHYGKTQLFHETMAALRPEFEAMGWHLVGAYGTFVGDLHEVHDIWEVDDANAVIDALLKGGENSVVVGLAPHLAEAIEREVISIVQKTPYSD